MNVLASYQNGNGLVTIYDDGTKVLEYPDNAIPQPVFPTSIDVKITGYCDLGCAYCHEMSTRKGTHGNLDEGLRIITALPVGTEIAIGGGNPLSHPDLQQFLEALKDAGIIANLTVNQGHLKRFQTYLQNLLDYELIHGLGISFQDANDPILDQFMTPNTVLHMILGVHSPNDLRLVQEKWPNAKVLLLGYKTFGFGEKYQEKHDTNGMIEAWYRAIHTFFQTGLTVSFDNLGIEQLALRRFFTDRTWEQFYMGDDGTFTMYLDLVKQEYARTSTAKDRYSSVGMDIRDMFAHVRRM